MKRIIRIGKPCLEKAGDGLVRLRADAVLPERTVRLWFGVEERYDYALTADRADPFAAALAAAGMRLGADIVCDAPVSRRLVYRLNHTYIPALAFAFPDLKEIRVDAEPAGPCETAGAVGCAGAPGVNSLYTAVRNLRGEYPVTHLCLFNAGFGEETGRALLRRQYGSVRSFAERRGIGSLFADSNLHEIRSGDCPDPSARDVLLFPLALQGLFGTYHYASVFRDDQFRFSARNPAFYDPLTVHCFGTESLRLFLSGGAATRTEKLSALADFPEEAAMIHPCAERPPWEKNCCACAKCVRDMTAICAAGKKDRFAKAFDFAGFEEKIRNGTAFAPGGGEDVPTA